MVTKRLTMRAVAGLSLWTGFGSAAQAQLPALTAKEAFEVQPRQKGVNVTTPTPDVVARCTVAPIPNPKDPKNPMGYVVRDPAGRPIRQFVSYDGKSFNIIAFYIDGAEAYREVYPPQAGEAYQFRWLGTNGTKWGLDKDRDGRIDEWVMISPEELSQELLQAVLTRDVKRAEALVLNKGNLDSIGFQGAEAEKLLSRAAGIATRVTKVADDLKAAPTSDWLHLELNAPQAIPSDAIGARDDLVIHKTGTILLKDGANSKSLQTGELVQIGRAWKLIDGPSVGISATDGIVGPIVIPAIADLVAELDKIDRKGPDDLTIPSIAAHNARRGDVLEKIYAKLPGDAPEKMRETWTKLLIDSLSAGVRGREDRRPARRPAEAVQGSIRRQARADRGVCVVPLPSHREQHFAAGHTPRRTGKGSGEVAGKPGGVHQGEPRFRRRSRGVAPARHGVRVPEYQRGRRESEAMVRTTREELRHSPVCREGNRCGKAAGE